eukprot:UN34108
MCIGKIIKKRIKKKKIRKYDDVKRILSCHGIGNDLDPNIINHLVLHRGYHCSQDELNRPLENTLRAYEVAWSSGMLFCECDVCVTNDGKLVLNHDETTERLSLLKINSQRAMKRLQSFNFEELLQYPLKNGDRIPLLEEVLNSASYFKSPKKLVVEIKHQEKHDVVREIIKFFKLRPHLLKNVELFMSFNLPLISRLKKEYEKLDLPYQPYFLGLLCNRECIYPEEYYKYLSIKDEQLLDRIKILNDIHKLN